MNIVDNLKQTLNASSNVLRILLVLSLTLILSSQGYLYYKRHLNPPVVDPYAGLTKVNTSTAMFYSEDRAIKQRTQVIISYIPPKEYTRIWLELAVDTDVKQIKVLLSHPQLDELKWSKLETSAYTLFQKEFKYKSIDDFIANPPKNKNVILDPDTFANKVIPDAGNIIEMTNKIDLETTDFILAKYHQPVRQGRYFISDNMIDATNAMVTDGKLSWYMNIPAISSSDTWYIQKVKINYHQPK